MNEKKSMNTHLHIMEAYTNLLRVWRDVTLEKKLREIIILTIEKIVDTKSGHFMLFFDDKWNRKSDIISYGHDIEGSWLLLEAAEVLGDQEIIDKVKKIAVLMADVTLEEGTDTDGSLFYEANPSAITDSVKHWWPQAEAAVGFLNAYQLTGEMKFFDAFAKVWDYIDQYVIDHRYGEWFSQVSQSGSPDLNKPKVYMWKCPYHNSRACYEVMDRLLKIKN